MLVPSEEWVLPSQGVGTSEELVLGRLDQPSKVLYCDDALQTLFADSLLVKRTILKRRNGRR